MNIVSIVNVNLEKYGYKLDSTGTVLVKNVVSKSKGGSDDPVLK